VEVIRLETTIRLPDGDGQLAVTGISESNLKIIRESLAVQLVCRNGILRLSGEPAAVRCAAHVVDRLIDTARRGTPMSRQELLETVAATGPLQRDDPAPQLSSLEVYLPGRQVKPLTEGQQIYLSNLLNSDLTFCTGPAGTGKTYLAVAAAVSLLKTDQVRRLVLVRPAVEAGEKLGFLPGTMQEKVHPYLRPLLDGLHDMMPYDQIERFMAADLIEIIPLAFMRGRTFNDSLIILDEAQNTTQGQMLMFLTRLGHGSKMVVTGDTSQIDLENPQDSGLVDVVRRLGRTPGVALVSLARTDIVRHPLVQRVVDAYGDET